MQRWHLTVGLLLPAVALATAVLPSIEETPVPVVRLPTPRPETVVGGNLTLRAGLDRSVIAAGSAQERYLVVTLTGETADDGPERPFNVSVVLDRSGSMASSGKLDYARLAIDELLAGLDERDRFSLVTFSNQAGIQVSSRAVDDPRSIRRAVMAVSAGGGTNLGAGLTEGLTQVLPFATGETQDRVIVLSDGRVNQGETSADALARLAGRYGAAGVTVSAIGLGLDYNEDLLARVADWGGGSYHFVDRPEVLASIFHDELQRMSSVAAEGVAVEVALQPGVELVDVLGYEHSVTSQGVRIRVGEILDGETRKVVMKVKLPASGAGTELGVAAVHTVRADGPALAPVEVLALASADLLDVEASADRELAILGTQAEASVLADEGVRAWERGDVDEMQRLMGASRLVAGEAAGRYGSSELDDLVRKNESDQQNLEAARPMSQEGRYQAILQKEANRDANH